MVWSFRSSSLAVTQRGLFGQVTLASLLWFCITHKLIGQNEYTEHACMYHKTYIHILCVYICSLVPRLLPYRKMGRESRRFDHVPRSSLINSLFGLALHNWLQQLSQTGILSLSGGYKEQEARSSVTYVCGLVLRI